jgi:leucyl-tRNA synthetase
MMCVSSTRFCRYLKRHEVRDAASARPVEIATGAACAVGYEKMSKSKYNGVDPDDMVATWGADTTRLFVLFKAPPDKVLQWDEDAIEGQHRWLKRVWQVCHAVSAAAARADAVDDACSAHDSRLLALTNACIAAVTQDMEQRRFNSAIAELMKLTNSLTDASSSPSPSARSACVRALLQMLAPLAPHVACELWEVMGGPGCVLETRWPVAGDERAQTEVVAVQIGGKLRGTLDLPAVVLADHEQLKQAVLQSALATKYEQCMMHGTPAMACIARVCVCAVGAHSPFARMYPLASASRVIVAKSGKTINFLI